MGKLEIRPSTRRKPKPRSWPGADRVQRAGYALFRLGKNVELVVGLTLVAAFYLGGVLNPIDFVLKTGGLLLVMVGVHAVMTRMRIEQTVGLWWRYGALLVLVQILIQLVWKVAAA